jgi:transposase InsO family protein
MLPASRFSEPPATILVQAVEAEPFVPQSQESTAGTESETEGSTSSWQEEIAAASQHDEEYQEVVAALRSEQATVPAVIQRAKVNPGQCRVASNDVVFVEHRCWVPQHEDLRRRIVQSLHSAPAAGHPGVAGTLDLIRRHFYWPKMTAYIRRFIAHCRPCRTTRSLNTQPAGLLHPLPVPGQPWSEIAMDFVSPLPASKSFEGVVYENILTVTCRLTKERHLIPVKSMSAKNTARILCRDVFAKHGLPLHALSDRGPQFTSSFMRYAYRAFGVDQRLTSSYHPQGNGQAENTNKGMEKFLRAHVNYKQDDWVDWLWMAEFVANNSVSATTRVSPFFANRGVHPRMADADFALPISSMPPVASFGPRKIDELAAQEFALEMTKLHQQLRQEMARAQLTQADSANQHRSVHPTYKVGDFVYVSTRNWSTTRPTKKLDYRFAGPYRIVACIGEDNAVTYKLDLPDSLGLRDRDNAFHCSLLQPSTTVEGPLAGQVQEPPAPIEVLRQGDDEAEKEYEVEQILDSKVRTQRGRVKAGQARRTRVEYLVQWKGYPNPTWERQESLRGAPEMVADYYHRAPVGTEPMPDELKSLLSSSAASLPTASRQAHTDHDVKADLEDDETFARIAHEMQGVKARWNSPV